MMQQDLGIEPRGRGRIRAGKLALALCGALAGVTANAATTKPGDAPGLVDVSGEAAPKPAPCPSDLPDTVTCLSGHDSAGAYYMIAKPRDWNGVLVMHAHGGPTLGDPKLARAQADLKRWAVWPRNGYAVAMSSYHQGGVEVHAAAQDTERLRRIFLRDVGKPRLTILHGQSWGGNVGAIAAELYGTERDGGKPAYDGVLLTSGVLAGGTRAYDFRIDLRVVYQALCHNHPLPSEPQYPLWMGLPPDSTLTKEALAKRVDQCLGVDHPRAERTAAQQQRLDTLTRVIGIQEDKVVSHLNWATWHFQDIVQHRTDGKNPFGNIGVRYTGSPDDAKLNAEVARYRPDPQAVAKLRADTDPTGKITLPELTMHAANDPTAFVEMEHTYHDIVAKAGRSEHLVQVFTSDHEHSYLTDADYLAAMGALLDWVEHGRKPTPQSVAQRCQAGAPYDPPSECTFLPDYHPAALETRSPARGG